MGAKPFRIRFDKVDGFIRVYDGTRYSVLFGDEKYDFISTRIRYLIGVKSGIAYVISHNSAKIRVDSYDSLPLEKSLTFHNVIILIKSVFNKDTNRYYYNMFLEMLYFDRIDVSEGIDINKTNASKECANCHYYWYFLDKGFTFQRYISNGCHEVLMMSINHNNIAILSINGADYRCIFG